MYPNLVHIPAPAIMCSEMLQIKTWSYNVLFLFFPRITRMCLLWYSKNKENIVLKFEMKKHVSITDENASKIKNVVLRVSQTNLSSNKFIAKPWLFSASHAALIHRPSIFE